MMADTVPATKNDMERLFLHLESELDESGFFRVAEKRPGMARNIRNIFNRANLTHQEVQTLRGMIVAMRGGKHKPKD